MRTFTTDYVYRVAERQRRHAMAVRMTPAGKFWTTYFTAIVIAASLALAYYKVRG